MSKVALAKYYQTKQINKTKKASKKARERYQVFSREQENKKLQYLQ